MGAVVCKEWRGNRQENGGVEGKATNWRCATSEKCPGPHSCHSVLEYMPQSQATGKTWFQNSYLSSTRMTQFPKKSVLWELKIHKQSLEGCKLGLPSVSTHHTISGSSVLFPGSLLPGLVPFLLLLSIRRRIQLGGSQSTERVLCTAVGWYLLGSCCVIESVCFLTASVFVC